MMLGYPLDSVNPLPLKEYIFYSSQCIVLHVVFLRAVCYKSYVSYPCREVLQLEMAQPETADL